MKIIVTANKISFRTGRSAKYAHIKGCAYLTKGKTAELLDKDLSQTYAHVKYGNYTGYVYSKKGKYLKAVPEAPVGLPPKVKAFLDIVKSCVGGKYIYGAQGDKITTKLVKGGIASSPEYYTGGRAQMLLAIAAICEKAGQWKFPNDYAWDCSGLFWYAENKTGLFTAQDATAHVTYHNYCVPIKLSEVRPGDCLFRKGLTGRITHMAVVGENGVVYEAMSGYVGVVQQDSIKDRTAPKIVGKGSLKKSAWNLAGRPKCFI